MSAAHVLLPHYVLRHWGPSKLHSALNYEFTSAVIYRTGYMQDLAARSVSFGCSQDSANQ